MSGAPKAIGWFRTIGRFFSEWGGLMSGGISVPLAVIALCDFWSQQALFATLAYVAVLVFALGEIAKRRALEEWFKPRLTVTCGPGVEDSVTRITIVPVMRGRDSIGTYQARYYRAYVQALSTVPVRNCRGVITRIEQDGKKRWGGDEAILTFAPGEGADTAAKTISEKVPAFLDVVYVQNDAVAIPATVGRAWRFGDVFGKNGDFVITVVISADEMADFEFRLLFSWKGNWNDSTLVRVETPTA